MWLGRWLNGLTNLKESHRCCRIYVELGLVLHQRQWCSSIPHQLLPDRLDVLYPCRTWISSIKKLVSGSTMIKVGFVQMEVATFLWSIGHAKKRGYLCHSDFDLYMNRTLYMFILLSFSSFEVKPVINHSILKREINLTVIISRSIHTAHNPAKSSLHVSSSHTSSLSSVFFGSKIQLLLLI